MLMLIRTGSSEKLQNDLGTETGPKIAFNFDLRNVVLSVFLGHRLLDQDSPSPWTKN